MNTQDNPALEWLKPIWDTLPVMDPTEQHFEVGDTAWIYDRCGAEQVVITEVDDYFAKQSPGGYIFYWYRPLEDDSTVWEKILWEIKYRYCQLLGKVYHPPYWLGSGHAELAGRGNVLFRSARDAELNYVVTDAYYDITRLHSMVTGKPEPVLDLDD